MDVSNLVRELLTVVAAGAVSAMVCRRLGLSLLAGYLLVGALIGHGGLNLLGHPGHELELLAETGALFLLFSVGIEFSFGELKKLGRFFLIGGAVQMLLVAAPLTIAARIFGLSPHASLLAGTAGALSSTVLVFRALGEKGELESSHGRRAIAVLLFQDVALVPLLMMVPMLTGAGEAPGARDYLLLAARSVLYVAEVIVTFFVVNRWLVPLIVRLKSVELVVLFSVSLLGVMAFAAYQLEMPPAIGALAAGIVLSGNRLSRQIDSVLLPFRETFASIFFVSLGMLLEPSIFLSEPVLLTAGFMGIVSLKTLAAATAFRFVGLSWIKAFGMGLVLGQLGEFSFLLVARGTSEGLLSAQDYNRMLFIGMATLLVTPLLIKIGLRWVGEGEQASEESHQRSSVEGPRRAVVIGAGPVGGQIAQRLELVGIDVALIDLSSINLHVFAQLGFVTHTGDARETRTLEQVDVRNRKLTVICVPSDNVAEEIVRAVRQFAPANMIVVRCRYQANMAKFERAGASLILSEEAEASEPLMKLCLTALETMD